MENRLLRGDVYVCVCVCACVAMGIVVVFGGSRVSEVGVRPRGLLWLGDGFADTGLSSKE